MNHTTNYQLSQWSADDRVQRVDFNADNAKIDAALAGLQSAVGTIPKIAAGHYIGDGAESRVIPLDFTPKAVYVCADSGAAYRHDSGTSSYYYGGLAVTGASNVMGGYSILEIVSGGFKIGYRSISESWNVVSNQKDLKYRYIAFG